MLMNMGEHKGIVSAVAMTMARTGGGILMASASGSNLDRRVRVLKVNIMGGREGVVNRTHIHFLFFLHISFTSKCFITVCLLLGERKREKKTQI
jgi:hypothetical protein